MFLNWTETLDYLDNRYKVPMVLVCLMNVVVKRHIQVILITLSHCLQEKW